MRIVEEVKIHVPKDKEGLMYFGDLVKKYYLENTSFSIKENSKFMILTFTRETEVKYEH